MIRKLDPLPSLLISTLVAITLSSAAYVISNYMLFGRDARSVAINLTFFISLLLTVYKMTKSAESLTKYGFIASIIFIVISILSAVLALVIARLAYPLTVLLAAPITVVGYYPAGADVWFPAGALIWALSVILIINGAVASAAYLRSRNYADSALN